MTPVDLIRDGRLSEAREILVERIKVSPGDTKARTLIFQILAICGEWDKANKHLELLISQLPEAATGLLVYRNLVAAEKVRQEVASGSRLPDFMTGTPQYLTELIETRKLLARGDIAAASATLGLVPAQQDVSGQSESGPFHGFNECDATFSGILEVFVHDRYIWFPISMVRELLIQKPKTLLDTLWVPGRVVTWDGLTSDCYFPVLYPGSATHENDQVRMGRMTDWIDLGNNSYQGVGQHLFMVGEQEKGLLELGELTFDLSIAEVCPC